MNVSQPGARVYALAAIRYQGTVPVIHKGGKGTVTHVLGHVPYVKWDWTGETYPADARQLRRIG